MGRQTFLVVSVWLLLGSAGVARGARTAVEEVQDFHQRVTVLKPGAVFTDGCSIRWTELDRRLGALEGKLRKRPPVIRNGRPVFEQPRLPTADVERFRADLGRHERECPRNPQEAILKVGEEDLLRLQEALAAVGAVPDAKQRAPEDEARLKAEVEVCNDLLARAGADAGNDEGVATMGREATIRLEALERLVRGQSCSEELLPALSRMANGSVELGVEALVNMADRPCLTARVNADVRASVAAAVNGILASPATVEGVPVPRERIPRIAGLLAGLAASKRDDLLERARRETESPPPGPPAGTTAADSPAGPAARSGVEVAAIGKTGAGVEPAPTPKPDPVPAGPPSPRRPKAARPTLAPAAPRDPTWLAMDVWQSAWGDFSDFDSLVRYLATNHVSEVFLNPGIGTSEILQEGGSRKVEKLVRQLRDGGVPRIGFLYAELNYPIREFARFLRSHPDLGIDLLVDDSEFTDSHRERFRTNAAQVQAEGIRYAAFVSVEKVGNSGVSRATREWAIEHLDELFLMSYFSCDLDGQRELLEGLLKHADEVGERTGRRQFVRIGVLMGKKSTGKEVSCEKVLRKELFPAFLVDLHRWALSTHPSYGGIVLETNEKFPSFDVAPNAWAPR